ncbi:hypothetical protein V6N11_071253 [Hibiscus sabdariffa]|uniref:Uncharacterized protein n=1 Tax=Hibiscus sabdariffa TaxID=183260 RepID=A0ABR2TZT0_9ROSI
MEASTTTGNFPLLVVFDGSTKVCLPNSDMDLSSGPSPAVTNSVDADTTQMSPVLPSPAPARVCDGVNSSPRVPVQAIEVSGSLMQAQSPAMSQSQMMGQCVEPSSEIVAHSNDNNMDSGSPQ